MNNKNQKYTEDNEFRKLSKMDIIKSWFTWFMFSHSSYNYERLQANSFAHYMLPILKKLYSSDEDIAEGLKRHSVFFNTEPNVGSVIHGIVTSMEEKKANGEPVEDEGINALKTGLMGPVAGIGDTVMQGVLLPILLAFGIGLAMDGNLMGPILYTIIVTIATTGISFSMWMMGNRLGDTAIDNLLESGKLNTFMDAAKILGCMVIGALTSQYVFLQTKLSFTSGEETINFQEDVLDKVMPNLLPLLLTLGVLKLLNIKITPIKIIGILAVLGAIGAIFGIFEPVEEMM